MDARGKAWDIENVARCELLGVVTILGPTGFGRIKLGMTPAEADAANVFTFNSRTGSPCFDWRTAKAFVAMSSKLGIAAINLMSMAGVRTPEGMQVG